MNSAELKKLLKRHGCTFETARGKGGHITVRRGDKKTVMPVHGSRKELGTGLVAKSKKTSAFPDAGVSRKDFTCCNIKLTFSQTAMGF